MGSEKVRVENASQAGCRLPVLSESTRLSDGAPRGQVEDRLPQRVN